MFFTKFFICFHRHDKDDEARAIFQQAYENDSNNLRAYQNLQNVKNKTSRWHFRMLNDSGRNFAFQQAIQYWVGSGTPANFIDIGAGTGLLSLYAAQANFFKNIYAIECSPTMLRIAEKVMKENSKLNQVKLIEKHSKDVKIGVDISEKASLIVSETLDCGAFGEGILDTLIHAKKELLKTDGQIVPWKVKIHVAGYQSKSLCTNRILVNETFHEYLFLHNFRLIANNCEPYDSAYVEHIQDFKIVTDSVDTLEVNFNDLENMKKCFNGEIVQKFQLQSDVSNDYLDGFVTWFTLCLNPSQSENDISSAPFSGSCWNQTLFKLKERVLLEKYQILKLAISCKDGILQIHHELDNVPGKIDLIVDEEVLIYLNDDEYLREVEFAVSKHKEKFTNCLDLSNFPYVGMLLLKDGRLKKLYCRKDQESLIRKIADKNLINPSKLMFVEKYEITNEIESVSFQLIILHPFHSFGDIDCQLICDYNKYSELLTPNGLIVPKKITICAELINSDWLVDSCRVTNSELKNLKIDKFMNELSTELHLDLNNSLDHEKLTDSFEISEIFRDEFSHERVVEVPMKNINLPIHAIFYFYKILLTDNVPEIHTNRNKAKLTSCFRRISSVLKDEIKVDGSFVKIHFHQNYGIFKCDIEQ